MIPTTAPGRLVPLLLVTAATVALGSKVETWRQDSSSDFAKAKKERVVISDAGRVRLGRAVEPTEGIDATQVWDLVRAGDSVYAATGNAGKVFRRQGDGKWTLALDADDSQALTLAALPDGRVFAGTGPTGQVVEVTDPKHPASRPDKDVLYIWDLAADRLGNLYAATGPTGQLWKRSPQGDWSLLLDSKHPHLLCVAVGPDGSVFAGSDGEGLIYKVEPGGQVSVLYDAPQSEIRTLLIGSDDTLLAGTASESGGGSPGPGPRGLPTFSAIEERETSALSPTGGIETARVPQVKGSGRPSDSPGPGGSAAPRTISPGENSVYRISPDGAVREVFHAKALIFALALEGDRLLVGTGPEGLIYEVRGFGRESAPIARLDHGQALALLPGTKAGNGLLIGTGDPGAVLRLSGGYQRSGTILSDVHDAKLRSRFGALTWKADTPAGTSMEIQMRSGNVGEPDATWIAWTPAQSDPTKSPAKLPPGRFVQYRATLKTDDPSVSPELRSVSLLYQTVNLPPEVSKLDVPDLSSGDGATKSAKLNLRWEANDPNGDDLQYTLSLRKDGWPDWVRLVESPLTEKNHSWDASSVPGGTYRLRLSASDRPSNGPDEALTTHFTSESFVIDHLPPTVVLSTKGTTITAILKDDLTRLTRASYALDGGDWVSVFPVDGLFDTPNEALEIPLPDLKTGTHVLLIRATDAAGNVGTGDAVIVIP